MLGREWLGEATRSLGEQKFTVVQIDFKFGLRNVISTIDVGREEDGVFCPAWGIWWQME